MPSSNGVYSLPVGYLAVTGTTIQASQHNPPLEDIAAALTGRLSRDGTAPMTGPLALAVGTVAAPGVAFATDPTTGFYKTTGGFGVAVGGAKVAEFLAGGILGARYLGEVFPCMLSTAPPLCVFPVGQTLSRTTYAALWAVAQVEIAASNTFFNNGNGSTTFGIGDMRGRVVAALDGSGTILNSFSFPSGSGLGAFSGTQAITLTAAQVPSITSAGTLPLSATNILNTLNNGLSLFSSSSGANVFAAFAQSTTSVVGALTASGTVTSNNTGGGAHINVQPTMIGNYALFAGA